jgi:membrane associated rhomboid family serine protease
MAAENHSRADVPQLPPVTKYLLIAMAICFGLQNWLGPEWTDVPFALWPWGSFNLGTGSDGLPLFAGFQPWQLISYAFLHGGFMHILFNGIGIWQFGSRVESGLGSKRFAQLFFVSVLGAGLCQLAVVSALTTSAADAFPTVGASGGVFGILVAYAILYPHDRVIIIPIPVPMSSRTMVIIYGVFSLAAGITGSVQGVAHFAHLGGLAAGWLLLRYWQKQPPFRKRRPPGPRLVR